MWMNGFMTLRVQQASQQQVTIAAREALHSLLRPDDVEVSAILVSTTSTATRSTATWRVAFAIGELASEDFAASRTTLLTLQERVASSRATVFSAEVENELLNVGTRGEDGKMWWSEVWWHSALLSVGNFQGKGRKFPY